jgi:hypothetical protein
VMTKVGFGNSNFNEMLLEAPSSVIKMKWMEALKMWEQPRAERLIGQGYLQKIHSGLTESSKWRFFVLTSTCFTYFREEDGEKMASVPLQNINSLNVKDNKSFQVVANIPFSKSGHYEVLLRADDNAVRNRWLGMFKTVLPPQKFAM